MDIHVERNPEASWSFAVCYGRKRYGKDAYHLVGTIAKKTDTICEVRNVLGTVNRKAAQALKQQVKDLGFNAAVVKVLRGNRKARILGDWLGEDSWFDYYRVDL